MSKKLFKKEKGELVTKGYLNDCLDERFTEFKKEFRKEINEDFERHVGALIEHYIDQLQAMFEGLDDRYVLRKEWNLAK